MLANIAGQKPSPERQEARDEMTSIKDEQVLDGGEQFESKSYKNRIFKK